MYASTWFRVAESVAKGLTHHPNAVTDIRIFTCPAQSMQKTNTLVPLVPAKMKMCMHDRVQAQLCLHMLLQSFLVHLRF